MQTYFLHCCLILNHPTVPHPWLHAAEYLNPQTILESPDWTVKDLWLSMKLIKVDLTARKEEKTESACCEYPIKL